LASYNPVREEGEADFVFEIERIKELFQKWPRRASKNGKLLGKSAKGRGKLQPN
jgi:hypothetical protein